jgi:hypothetical protein
MPNQATRTRGFGGKAMDANAEALKSIAMSLIRIAEILEQINEREKFHDD